MPHSVVSDLALHCLHQSACLTPFTVCLYYNVLFTLNVVRNYGVLIFMVNILLSLKGKAMLTVSMTSRKERHKTFILMQV